MEPIRENELRRSIKRRPPWAVLLMPALLVPILTARISTGNTLVPTDSAVRVREAELTGGSGACMTRGSA